MNWHCHLRTAALVVTLFFSSLHLGIAAATQSSNDELASRSELQDTLSTLDKQKTLTPNDKLIKQDISRTLALMDEIDRVKEDVTKLKQQVDLAPEQTAKAVSGLTAIKEGANRVPSKASLSELDMAQLEAQMNSVLDSLQITQEQLATYSSQLIALQTQPESIQSSMYSASQRIQDLRNQLNGVQPVSQNTLRDSQKVMLQTELSLLNQTMDFQRKQLEANTLLQDLLQKQRDYSTEYIGLQEQTVQILQEVISEKRLSISEETVKEAQNPNSEEIRNNPLISKALKFNETLSERLLTSTEKANTLIQNNIRVKNWLDRSLQSERNLKEQISVLKGSLLLSRILYQQQQNLPNASSIADVSSRIADLRLEQFDLNQQRDALFQGTTSLEQLGMKGDEPTNANINNALNKIVDARRELLDRLNKQLGEELRLSISLQINQQQLINVSGSLETTLKQQIFWVNSNKPIDWVWIKNLPSEIKGELSSVSFSTTLNDVFGGIFNVLFITIPGLLGIGILVWWRRGIDRKLAKLAGEIGQLKRDSQWHTPEAIFLTLIKTLPVTLVILGIGIMLAEIDESLAGFITELSKRLAFCWLVLGGIYYLLSSRGVSEVHFLVSPQNAKLYRRKIAQWGLAMVPLIFWSVLGEKYPLKLVDDVIGQIVIIVTLLVLTVLLFPMCRSSWHERDKHPVRMFIVVIVTLMPLVLLGLMLRGYFYTTLKLAWRWIDSLYLLMLWNITYAAAVRGLSVAARRLAYRRALARRQNMTKEGAEGLDAVEEPPMGLEQINQQTLRLTTMALFLLFASVFYWIWSDVFTVFSYLDSVALWHYSTVVEGSTVLQAVTLGSLLIAVLVVMVAYVMTHNLPGLLEVLVLSRMPLRQGTSYAITTILKYLITAIGVVAVSGALGVSWDKLQWLVAALSVGLGFGLQEIFANFVSGLIILFERPVRIGDTITIGTYSGTVSKIRIRATTITDFDRKEVIVPNKAFVTERLINWSLSDTVTRILIKVGVAYGSDLDKVKEVLLQAASENLKVMTDPEPVVFFLNFGASTLDHELRVYVRELRDRSVTVDELNRRIDTLCRENDINIAFNQLDVYLHNQQGTEVQEISRALKQHRDDEII